MQPGRERRAIERLEAFERRQAEKGEAIGVQQRLQRPGEWNITIPRPPRGSKSKKQDVAPVKGLSVLDDGTHGSSSPHSYRVAKGKTQTVRIDSTQWMGAGEKEPSPRTDLSSMVSMDAFSTTSLKDILRSRSRSKQTDLLQDATEKNLSVSAGASASSVSGEKKAPTFFPLDLFDDRRFEAFDAAAYLATKQSLGEQVNGFSLWNTLDGTTEWRPCQITAYDTQTLQFVIQWEHNGLSKRVGRLNLRFATESEDRHHLRRELALRNRQHFETSMRYERLIDGLPTEDQLQLSLDHLNSICSRVGLGKGFEDLVSVEQQELTADVRYHFSRTINKMDYDALYPGADPKQQSFEAAQQIGMEPSKFLELYNPPSNRFTQNLGTVDHDERVDGLAASLPTQVQDSLCWGTRLNAQCLLACRECIQNVWTFNANWSLDTTVSLSVLAEKQKEQVKRAIDQINDQVIDRITDEIAATYLKLEDIEGSVTLEMKKALGRLGDLLQSMAFDQLRFKLIDTIKDFVQGFRQVAADSNALLEQAAQADNVIAVLAERDRPCLLDVVLQVSRTTGELEMSPSIADITSTVKEMLLWTIDYFNKEIVNVSTSTVGIPSPTRPAEYVSALESTVTDALAEIQELFVSTQGSVDAVTQSFIRYVDFLKDEEDQYLARFEMQSHHLESYRRTIDQLRLNSTVLRSELPACVLLVMFRMTTVQLRDGLADKAWRLSRQLVCQVQREALEQAKQTQQRMVKMIEHVLTRPQSPEQLVEIQDYSQGIEVEMDELEREIRSVAAKLALMDDFAFTVSDEVQDVYWACFSLPHKLFQARQDVVSLMDEDRVKFMGELQDAQAHLTSDIEGLERDVKSLKAYEQLENADEYAETVRILQERFSEAEKTAELINSRENLFSFPISSFGAIQQVQQDFEPYAKLWLTAADCQHYFPEWRYGSFLSLDAETIEREVTTWWKSVFKLQKVFETSKEALQVATRLREDLDEFKGHVPLIQALRTPGLRERHWANLSQSVGTEIRPEQGLTLQYMLEVGVAKYESAVSELADVAAKEYSFEKALDKMRTEWSDLSFDLQAYKDTGTFTLRGLDDMTNLLDDHIMKAQAMRGSPFIKPLEKAVLEWNAFLIRTQETLDEWLQLQKTWLYLEPIFSSPDIMRQMPQEGRRFQAVDRMFRQTMENVHKEPSIVITMSNEALLGHFVEANKLLDQVQKGLNDYLETKRTAFPRFYFLSNDELLDILAETKDPRRVIPHLPKCFEGIANVTFESNLDITEMVSFEGECVKFSRAVQPDNDRNRGNVELWLLELEDIMRESLKNVLSNAIQAYKQEKRTDFVQVWPGQIVLAVDCIDMTHIVETALEQSGVEGLKQVEQRFSKELQDIVLLVRGQLTELARTTLAALVVIDVHNRDVVAQLAKEGVSTVHDFEWNAQLRYYFREEVGVVSQVNASLDYGYEYLGNSARLVITPLTDRCYRTLMGALHLQLGGAPQGPAGTGKTETTKDLSKAVAKQCVVFNCSDGLDYLAMAKFFKGLASCGAWSCFDEFNRIELEVLSVIAQQILTIQQGIRKQMKRIVFEGSDISLNWSCATFITMNPGYAGRTELPDNLKALFRPCAMMIPDYAMIAEIVLYSFGYTEARNLARKVVYSLRLSSEQLSSQDHYDFGMRAVKSILTAAGQLKRKHPESPEDVLCLRAINDVNLPKFVEADLPLFEGITSDLFLGISVPAPDYSALIEKMKEAAQEMQVDFTKTMVRKAVQLYETICVRHGLMVVGLTLSMKTTCIKLLASAMTKLDGTDGFHTVRITSVNPKSVTYNQLYGNFDAVTREWVEGVAAYYVRKASQDTSDARKWIVFDGPVDAIWIESMNTVLDDNKKLCLTSGEIIKLSDTMTMMFEPEDLAVASPATVSRCGMVYMEPQMLHWSSILKMWKKKNMDSLSSNVLSRITDVCDAVLDKLLFAVRKDCAEPVKTKDTEVVQSMLCMLEIALGLMGLFSGASATEVPKRVDMALQFAIIWSLGAATDAKSRKRFSELLQGTLTESDVKITQIIPDKNLPFDYTLDWDRVKWIAWADCVPAYSIPADAEFADILVPTIDTVRYAFLLDKLLPKGFHPMFVGPTGTGKTATILGKLLSGMPDTYVSHVMNFSARTSANLTQDILDGRLDKRRKGVFGPPLGKKMIVFVDDLNMPAKETYGAQPPIELLRQWMDHNGWYDRKDMTFHQLVDLTFLTAMGPPGGGRSDITCRYSRHFCIINLTPFGQPSLQRIFGTIMQWFVQKLSGGSFGSLSMPVVQATIDVFETISQELLPTPAKSHYTFNLRDISKVIQGILSIDSQSLQAQDDLVRLWLHETNRIFRDRLVDDDDRQWFDELCSKLVKKHFKKEYKTVIGEGADGQGLLLYGDFASGGPDAEARPYRPIETVEAASKAVSNFLDDYNMMTNKPMNIVLFSYVIQHLARISRVLRQPRGHALLVGVGGSGRQSLTRLAASIGEFDFSTVEITKSYDNAAWREDLKVLLQKAGAKGHRSVFLVSDTQLVLESMLEDINNLLNTGEVPNLFAVDELQQISDAVMPKAKAAGRAGSQAQVMEFFVSQCRRDLHVVLAMSPVGAGLRNRLRQFPSLVNCCTIDWFAPWPEEGLRAVASQFLAQSGVSESSKEPVIQMCTAIHTSVRNLSSKFLMQLKRQNYVTPTSYLELISTFKNILSDKRDELLGIKSRYETGLSKLLTCAEDVKAMQEELSALQPVLKQKTKEVEELLVTLQADQKDAAAMQTKCEAEEKSATAQAEAASELKASCEQDLAQAMPALNSAVSALKSLSKGDITEVKSMKSPPKGVKLVMEAVCIMFEITPEKVKSADGKSKVNDYWAPAQKLLADSNFLKNLFSFDKDNISEAVIEKLKPYISSSDFEPKVIEKVSKAANGLCKWVRAMDVYHKVAKVVEPKRARLKEAEADLNQTMADLKMKKEALQGVLDRITALEQSFEQANQEKLSLAEQVDTCEKKLFRAEKLISGLGGERERWAKQVEDLSSLLENVTGDVLVASAGVAYLGVFTGSYRDDAKRQWVANLRELHVSVSEIVSLQSVLGDQVRIRQWNMDGLPRDSVSIDNAIIMSNSRRWPLLIDPQGQAHKWIVGTHASDKDAFLTIKPSQSNFIRLLETAIQFGKAVLLENIGETIDTILEPVLLKQTYKSGGSMVVNLGDNTVEWSPDFKLYITTKLPNPHYPPEVSTKVALVNFTITLDGLQDQLLGITVEKERPELEEQRQKLVLQNAKYKNQLKELEDTILHLLSSSQGDILEDETMIETLSKSKQTSNEVSDALKAAEATEKRINETRVKYQPVAATGAVLFFAVADLRNVEPMYQYSLQWFVNLYLVTIKTTPPDKDVAKRVQLLGDEFTFVLYRNVCRSLFEKDKLMYSLLCVLRLGLHDGSVADEQVRFLLSGGVGVVTGNAKKPVEWMTDRMWQDVQALSQHEGMSCLQQSLSSSEDTNAWMEFMDVADPVDQRVPGFLATDKDQSPSLLQRLLIIKTLRPEALIPGVREFVSKAIGQRFVDPPPLDIQAAFDDSSPTTPLIFVLSPGADPMVALLNFAESCGMASKIQSLSLGQGQGPLAEQMIENAIDGGSWVVLQNCHLAASWMPSLERIVEGISEERAHPNFRLWLTSYPAAHFPVAVLQDGVKMTNEAPKGLRANMTGVYHDLDDSYFEDSKDPSKLKRLHFSLAFFHAVVQERRKFGPLGWNILYEFNLSDLRICQQQLKMFLEGYDDVPFKALRYTAGETNYGGRVTEDFDRRLLATILLKFYTPDALVEGYSFSPSGMYRIPNDGTLQDHKDYIANLPMQERPEVFGLHENANITFARQESAQLITTLQSVSSAGQGGSSGQSSNAEESLVTLCQEILSQLPPLFDIDAAEKAYPTSYEQSLNTVLTQELQRMNNLVKVVKTSLQSLTKAVKGLVVMSSDLEQLAASLSVGSIPSLWAAKSYPSLKPLSSYVKDLIERLKFFQTWLENGQPSVFWISGFFFTQSFLTGVLQNHARQEHLAVDSLVFSFKVLQEEPLNAPDEGCVVKGLFVDGARWNKEFRCLDEQIPKVLFAEMPAIQLVPSLAVDVIERSDEYKCPVYKTSERKGTLSTTGHSTNFVLTMKLPTQAPSEVWVRRGVALLCQLDD